jgi:hypothetical protein
MEIKTCNKTSIACPTQWEGHLEDGRMFYFRIRHDILTIQVSTKPIDTIDELGGLEGADHITLCEIDFNTESPWEKGYCTDEEFMKYMEHAGFTFKYKFVTLMDKPLYLNLELIKDKIIYDTLKEYKLIKKETDDKEI